MYVSSRQVETAGFESGAGFPQTFDAEGSGAARDAGGRHNTSAALSRG